MAKYITGTATGPGATDALVQVIRSHLTTNGWTEHDVLIDIAGQRDIVFRGAALDVTTDNRPFIRIKQVAASNTVDYLVYTDWDAVAHAGMNETGNTSGTTRQTYQDASFIYFIRANAVSIVIIARIGGSYTRGYIGFMRRQLPNHMSGMTSSSGATSAGSNTISVASDMTGKLYVGQIIWILNYAHSNGSANKNRLEKHTVSSVAAGTIGLGEVTSGDFDTGAIIGENPYPIVIGLQSAVTSPVIFSTWFPHNADATRSSATAQTGSSFYVLFGPVTSDNPSQIDQRIHLGLIGIHHNPGTAAFRSVRGYCYHLFVSSGVNPANATEDIGDDKGGMTYLVFGADTSNNTYIGPRES